MRIALTGTTGFIGSALAVAIAASDHVPIGLPRDKLNDIDALAAAMAGADAVIHLAGLAPRMGSKGPAPAELQAVNRQLPARVYAAAAKSGVGRFVFVSSIQAVSGNRGLLSPDLPTAPTTPFGAAKAGAETDLSEMAAADGPDLIIVRPPLVYGPGAKGSLADLLRLAARPMPLPFGAVDNRRSLVGVTNLCSALIFLATEEAALDHAVYHVTDGYDLSLRELLTTLREGLGREPNLWQIPVWMLRAGLSALARRHMAEQLLDDLKVDATTLIELGWQPPLRPQADLHAMARAYGAHR